MIFSKRNKSDDKSDKKEAQEEPTSAKIKPSEIAQSAPNAPVGAESLGDNTDISPADARVGGGSIDEMREKLSSKLMMATFGEIVSLMMKSRGNTTLSLADLQWLAIPPLVNNQFILAEAKLKDSGASVPIGAAFWAKVSPEVDARLSSDEKAGIKLEPDEWNSGDIYWLISVFGDQRATGGLVGRLRDTVFKDKTFKLYSVAEDGQRKVQVVNPGDMPTANTAEDNKTIN